MTTTTGTTTTTDHPPESTHGPALSELTAMLPGQVTLPGDPGWHELRLPWVRSVDQRPVAVVDVREEEDVVAVVCWAARHRMTVSAQAVGHGATAALDGTVLLRTRGLRSIQVDAEKRQARVGAGVKWGELLAATQEHGLTGLAGSSPDPSVVGFSLGGGLSWFGRAHGLAAHSIVAVDLVDPEGRLSRVTADSDPELFWALRGGGGDVGIVTAMEFRLHAAPHVYGGRLMWPVAMARPVLAAFREVTEAAPDELTAWAHLLRFPPLPEVPEPLRGGTFVAVDLTFLGTGEEAEKLIAPLRRLPARWLDTLGTVPLSELGGIVAEPVDPMPVSEWSGLLSSLDEEVVDRLLEAFSADGSPLMVVQVRHLGGALGRARPEDGPAGAVEEPYQLFCLGVPVSAEVAAAIEESFAGVREALAEQLTGRTMFTFLGTDDEPGRAFSAPTLRRLQAVKRRIDPHGRIRGNRPVLR